MFAFRVVGNAEGAEALATQALSLLAGVVSASFNPETKLVAVLATKQNIGVLVQRTLESSGGVVAVDAVPVVMKTLRITDDEVLQTCDVNGVRTALLKMSSVLGVEPEDNDKEHKCFQVWCLAEDEDNHAALIEQVDALTGFDSVIGPEV